MTARREGPGVAVIGLGWMGHVHARAYQRLPQHYPELPAPRLLAVAEADADRRADAAAQFGVPSTTGDWRDIVADERIDAVSVTAPNFLHREIGAAVAGAGKHLWIEKPVGLDAADARAVDAAVERAGVVSAVGFNYRNAPAVEHARSLIADGAIGRVTNARLRLLADYAAHPHGALSWRFERAQGGSGVLGDLASHGIDLARHLIGEVVDVVADTATFIAQRPRPSGAASHYAVLEGGEVADVHNEDYLNCLMHLDRAGSAEPVRASLETSRVSVGDQNNYGFELHGTRGSLSWDYRRMGELRVSLGEDYLDQPTSTVFVGPAHGDAGRFQPGAANPLGYDDLKVIEAARFVAAIAGGPVTGATIADAVAAADVLDALVTSARERRWVRVGS